MFRAVGAVFDRLLSFIAFAAALASERVLPEDHPEIGEVDVF